MTNEKLKEIVKGLNYGIKYFKLDFIHGSIYELVQNDFITESEIEKIERKYGYVDHSDILREIANKKATKLDSKFIKSF